MMINSNSDECPYCHSRLEKGLAPFHFHGSYLGQFEAYICDFCYRRFFTESAYHEIMEVPTSLDDFLEFGDQEITNTGVLENPPIVLLESKSDSSGNKVSTNEEEIPAS